MICNVIILFGVFFRSADASSVSQIFCARFPTFQSCRQPQQARQQDPSHIATNPKIIKPAKPHVLPPNRQSNVDQNNNGQNQNFNKPFNPNDYPPPAGMSWSPNAINAAGFGAPPTGPLPNYSNNLSTGQLANSVPQSALPAIPPNQLMSAAKNGMSKLPPQASTYGDRLYKQFFPAGLNGGGAGPLAGIGQPPPMPGSPSAGPSGSPSAGMGGPTAAGAAGPTAAGAGGIGPSAVPGGVGIGQGVYAPYFQGNRNLNVSPTQGVSGGTQLNAAGVGVGQMSSVNFGGLPGLSMLNNGGIPGLGSGVPFLGSGGGGIGMGSGVGVG